MDSERNDNINDALIEENLRKKKRDSQSPKEDQARQEVLISMNEGVDGRAVALDGLVPEGMIVSVNEMDTQQKDQPKQRKRDLAQSDSRQNDESMVDEVLQGNITYAGPQTHTSTDDLGQKKAEHADVAFDKMPLKARHLLYFCFLMLLASQMCLLSTLFIDWEGTEAQNKEMSNSTISFIISGFGLGSFISLMLINTYLKYFSRKNLWLILGLGFSFSFIVFASLPKLLSDASYYPYACWVCMLGVGIFQSPMRVIITATISKIYPNKIQQRVQISMLFIFIGALTGPLTCSVALNYMSLSTIFYIFSVFVAVICIFGWILMPLTKPQNQRDRIIGILAIMKRWRGLSNIINIFIGGCILRFQVNGISLFFENAYHVDPVEMGYLFILSAIVTLFFTIFNIICLRFVDYRIVYIFLCLIFSAIGQQIFAGFFFQPLPSLFQTLIGFFMAQNITGAQACENRDLTVVCQEILGLDEVPIAVKDVVATVIMFVFSLSTLFGSIFLGVSFSFIHFQTLLGICSLVLFGLAINYGFTTGLFRGKKNRKISYSFSVSDAIEEN